MHQLIRPSWPQDITGISPHSGSTSRHYEIPEWKRSTCPDERCAFVSESFPQENLSPYFSCAVGAEHLCSSSAKWLSVSSEFPEKFAATWSMAYFLRQCYFGSFEKKKKERSSRYAYVARSIETIFFFFNV